MFLIDHDYCLQDKTKYLKQEFTCPDFVIEEEYAEKVSKVGDRLIVEVKDEVSELVKVEVNNQVTNIKEEFKKSDECDGKFSQSSNLMVPQLHSEGESYPCDQCDRKFNHLCNLTVHKRVHSGEKPYQCDQCDKKFTQSSSLTVHKRSHSGEKPYLCDQCDKKFSQLGNLKEHKRSHSGEKPYLCSAAL